MEVRWLGLSPLGRDTATVCRRDFATIEPDGAPSQPEPSADKKTNADVLTSSAHTEQDRHA
jgi:hypothetical protein